MADERAREDLLTRTLARPLWLTLVLALLLSAPGSARAQAGADSLELRWTAPGDDGTAGTASEYDLRFSTQPIDAFNFDLATRVTSLSAPAPANSPERLRVRGLTRGTTYWFALRTRDATGNWSAVSNVLRWDWPVDAAPPAPPAALRSIVQKVGRIVRIDWRENTEPDLLGYDVYRSLHGANGWERLNGVPLARTDYVDDAMPADADGILDYAVTAVDVSGNESARSAAIAVVFGPVAPGSAGAWAFEPPYPNPSHLAQVAHLPLMLPPRAGAVRVEIRDGNDAVVRRIEVSGPGGGRRDIPWDGRNDAGQMCAPGVYRAWLIANGFQHMVRLARVP